MTPDYTLADFNVATVWGLPRDDAAGGWEVPHYPDGRRAAGVLAGGWLFSRIPSGDEERKRLRRWLEQGVR